MTSQQTADSCLRLADRVGRLALASGTNFVYSPLSVRAALSLAAGGSKGETLNQFLSFLGSPTIGDLNLTVDRQLGSVRSCRPADGGDSRLSFVNGIWVDRSTPLKGSFLEIASSVYDAIAESVDFQNQAPEVARKVNDWVEKATNGLVKDLLPRGSVSHDTRLVLANALYFKGIWLEKFNKSKTTDKHFHLLDGSTVEVPFMTSKDDQYLSPYDGFKVLRLPYLKDQEGRSFSLLIYLPDKIDGIHNLLETATDPDFFDLHVPKQKFGVGKFMIPKFKISSEFEASKFLKSLGLELPFSHQAEFTEMVSASSHPQLSVSNVHHKATIEVEEEGTTAAAATALMVKCCCYVKPENFVADHPFMFAIREDETGALLFLGHVADPLVAENSF